MKLLKKQDRGFRIAGLAIFPVHVIAITIASLLTGCNSQKTVESADLLSNDTQQLINWISTIGSDNFGGRKPMTRFEDTTINYLASEMDKLGLQPAFNGSWFQEVEMITTSIRPSENCFSFYCDGSRTDLKYPDDLIFWTARATDRIELSNCGVVFAGFGINAPEYGWNDFEGIDIKDKIVIAMVNDPGFYDSSLFTGRNMTYYGRYTYKFEQAEKMGAAACLVLHNTEAASYAYDVLVHGHVGSNCALYDKESRNMNCMALKGWITEDGCSKLMAASGLDFNEMISAAKKPGFKAVELKLKGNLNASVEYSTDVTHNVAGVLPGTDLKDEAIVFSAHWDHFGTSVPDQNGDSIYNGASDNGSGIAAIFLIAKKLKEQAIHPRRSLVFLSPTLEESGLFGSQYYCEHPAFPMSKTAACINFDCIAPAPLTKDISFLGGGQSNLDYFVMASAAAQGRSVFFDDDNSDGWYFRSDHYNFVKQGVPALVMENGKELVDPSKPNKYPQKDWYHQPSDEYKEDWDMSGTIANINVMIGAASAIANLDEMPKWNPESAHSRNADDAEGESKRPSFFKKQWTKLKKHLH